MAEPDSTVSNRTNTQRESASVSEAGHILWFIPHTHWEGAVFKTRAEYLEIGLPLILKALNLLKAYPDYRFTLDQVCFVKPFLERFPEEEAAFRGFVAEGRLQLVGGVDVMADVNMPSGESFVRQVLYGKGYYREKLGVDVTVGWHLDTFGHHAQMPQLLKLAGYRSFWFFRGVSSMDLPSEFLWEGLDGTRISAFWLPQGYAVLHGSPTTLPEFTDFLDERFDLLGKWSQGTDRVGLAGADVSEPEDHVPDLVEQFNRQPDTRFTVRLAVPTDFEHAVARHDDRQVITGELNPIFQGTYSSRIELKQWARELECLLITVEKLGALANWLGSPTGAESISRAWEPVLFNQAHDLASGVMTDRVYADTIRGYEFSKRLADELVETRLSAVLARIDTRGTGTPVVVFNPLGWARTDVAEVTLGVSDGGVRGVEVLDPEGQTVPVQFLETQRGTDEGLRRIRIAFLARDVPALGHCVYHIVPVHGAGTEPVIGSASPPEIDRDRSRDTLENEHYRATFDLLTGAMTGLLLKSSGWQVLDGPANVVARQHDAGDFWELYRPLDGGSRVAMKGPQPVPGGGDATFSHEFAASPGSIRFGPVLSEFRIVHPFGSKGKFATTVRMYTGLRRIEISTQLLNDEKFVRYQVLFPTSIKDGLCVHEIPFGAVERPSRIEFPAQNWVDYGDGTKGTALLNIGLPGNVVSDGTLMLSLMRATRIVAYGFQGGYEEGMSSDTGFALDRELSFRYALVPHAGDWREAKVYRHGIEFNNPLIVRKSSPHPGSLPRRWGLLEVSRPNCVVSALKPGKDGTIILRVYEATGRTTPGVTIRLEAELASVSEADLLEEAGPGLPINDNAFSFDLAPFEIKTFELKLRRGHA